MLHEKFTRDPRIAYFSMEIALAPDIPTYSGGLGVLAGDTIRSAADLQLPIVGVTLASRDGYFRQEITPDGRQVEHPSPWDPAAHATRLHAGVAVPVDGREVWVSGWLYVVTGQTGAEVPVLLLDTDIPLNAPEDRDITRTLYGGDNTYRLKQEIVLGMGGFRMLQALGFEVRRYHLNEGHSALLTLELMRKFTYAPEDMRPGEATHDLPRVRALCNFTTHTPVEAGHDRFAYDLVQQMLGDDVDLPTLQRLGGPEHLNMTCLALNLSEYVNGVARSHAEVSRRMFPGYAVHAITNGVHPVTWTHAALARLYDHHIPAWRHEPELLSHVDAISGEALWEAHAEAKRALIEHVRATTGTLLEFNRPIIGFARRMTAYKRPELLFSDLDRLRAIGTQQPFQLVLAGKAHPRDDEGKAAIARLHQHLSDLAGVIPAVFLPDYDMSVALAMVSGVDVWLNTPQRPMEASGTSGMKAAFNGVPQLSVLDGWWIEGCVEGVTGWAIGGTAVSANGSDAQALYDALESKVLPLWLENRPGWIEVMKGAIGKNAAYFNSHRMMRRYLSEAYIH